jgi:multisubunit Na+/H+ antiporter MnhC subunit
MRPTGLDEQVRRTSLGEREKQLVASVLVGVFLLTAVVIDAAVAHTYVAETSLSIHKEPRGITQAGT